MIFSRSNRSLSRNWELPPLRPPSCFGLSNWKSSCEESDLNNNLRVAPSVYPDLNFRYVGIRTIEICVDVNLTVDRRGFHFMLRDKLHHLIVRKRNLTPTTFVNQGYTFKRLSPLKMKLPVIARQDFSDRQ